MSRYTGPKTRVIKKFGPLPGFSTKRLTAKQARIRPGQHGRTRKKLTPYAERLIEKQKIRFNYGLTEKHLFNYVRKARKASGFTDVVLLKLIEMRLDNTLFRAGLTPTISAARQFISHCHIAVNGCPVSIPSYQCRPGDLITVRKQTSSRSLARRQLTPRTVPNHLKFSSETLTVRVLKVIDQRYFQLKLNGLAILEYYSRRL